MNDINKDENFRTSDLNLATFLCVKGFDLVGIENDSQRKTFVFVTSSQLKEMIEIFLFGKDDNPKLAVNARQVLRTIRELKIKLSYYNI